MAVILKHLSYDYIGVLSNSVNILIYSMFLAISCMNILCNINVVIIKQLTSENLNDRNILQGGVAT